MAKPQPKPQYEDDTSGRESGAKSDFRAFLSSYRNAIFFQAQNMHEQAAPHVAAAREGGRYRPMRSIGTGNRRKESRPACLLGFLASPTGP
jgi:hypothetical protein